MLGELQSDATRRVVSSASLALAYGAVGERDKAFALLDQEIADRGPRVLSIGADPRWDDISDDPRDADALRMRRINRIQTIQGTLAIEGNTLDVAQITAILDGKRVIAPPRQIQEARNAIKAYDVLLPHLSGESRAASGKARFTSASRRIMTRSGKNPCYTDPVSAGAQTWPI